MRLRITQGAEPQVWDSRIDDISHVEVADGIDYTIHPLETRLAGTAFESILIEPDERTTDYLTLFFYGIGADYHQYRDLAQEMGKQGMPVALHKRAQARNLRLMHPYIHGSETAVAVADAAHEYAAEYFETPFAGQVNYAHSKGGLDTVIHANYDDRTSLVINDATSGAVRKLAMWNHVESAVPILQDIKSIIGTIPPEDRPEMIEQFGKNKGLLALELVHLLAWRPDVTKGLEELKEKNVPVIYITREKDTIFKDKDTTLAANRLQKRGLISEHIRVENSRHHAPFENPDEVAQLLGRIVRNILG